VWLPPEAEPRVAAGDRVRGGASVIAVLGGASVIAVLGGAVP
jgi:hypothetical protein